MIIAAGNNTEFAVWLASIITAILVGSAFATFRFNKKFESVLQAIYNIGFTNGKRAGMMECGRGRIEANSQGSTERKKGGKHESN